ncbi:MAG TPA: hypothetical protein VFA46_02770 [Actinomycetes bacterium]|nr:hypothetical protein [Actinomycetes bacterium]
MLGEQEQPVAADQGEVELVSFEVIVRLADGLVRVDRIVGGDHDRFGGEVFAKEPRQLVTIEWASGATAVAMFAYGVSLSYSVLHRIALAAGLPGWAARLWPLGLRRSWPPPP